jgi:2-C-methyl-D-erythritol 4-phosphate cytidylyltransferase
VNFAIILAAGKSRRMKNKNKIFCKIEGKPIIYYTLFAFEKSSLIDRIILVGRKADFGKFIFLIKKYKIKKVSLILEGGKDRQDSSFLGFKGSERIGAKVGDLILFQNGANPLLSQKELADVLKEAKKYGAAIAGQPARDTVKKINKKGLIVETIDRNKVFLAQTPQVLEYSLARKSFLKAKKDKFEGTDEASLAERLGKKVKAVPCSCRNFKITTKEDLKILKAFLKK